MEATDNHSLYKFWHLYIVEALTRLSSRQGGLAAGEVAQRVKQYWLNTLKAQSKASLLILLLSQF
ncbi:cation-transporting P-type ATPase [Mucilaginibacter sp. UYCu711]|uniref:cation-transporting P-type ATPase n=1 Tax=Mucilaginibacter sp. UYCu711 TaxID=3156339 RepID=UPI003D1BFF54